MANITLIVLGILAVWNLIKGLVRAWPINCQRKIGSYETGLDNSKFTRPVAMATIIRLDNQAIKNFLICIVCLLIMFFILLF
jgi:hypothetical protein